MYPAREHPFRPSRPVPPGETLAEHLDEVGMTRQQLAARLQMSAGELDRLIAGADPLTRELASQLAAATGIPARLWRNLEADYRAAQTRNQQALQRRRHIRIAVVLAGLFMASLALSWTFEHRFGFTGVLIISGVVLAGGTAYNVYLLRFVLRDDAEGARRERSFERARQRAMDAASAARPAADERE